MTNLEWLKKTINGKEGDLGFCAVLCEKVKNKSCDGISCQNCDFNYFEKVIDYLLQEHKEKIKLKKMEYDIISYYGRLSKFNDIHFLMTMKNKGNFKDMNSIEKCSMTIKEILENCEIVPDDYKF